MFSLKLRARGLYVVSEDNNENNNSKNRCFTYPNAKFRLVILDETFHFQLQSETKFTSND